MHIYRVLCSNIVNVWTGINIHIFPWLHWHSWTKENLFYIWRKIMKFMTFWISYETLYLYLALAKFTVLLLQDLLPRNLLHTYVRSDCKLEKWNTKSTRFLKTLIVNINLLNLCDITEYSPVTMLINIYP